MVANIGYGTQIAYATLAAPTTWNTIPAMVELTPPPQKADGVDTTAFDSAGGYRESIPGLADLAVMSFKVNWDPASTADSVIQSLFKVISWYRLTFPSGATLVFKGFIQEIAGAVPIADKMTAQMQINPTGAPVYAAAAAPVNTVLPAVSGLLANGNVLTVYEGSWTNGVTSYSYQWKKGGTNIGGATNKTYTTLAGDVAGIITCAVTAINSAGSTTATSSNLGPIT